MPTLNAGDKLASCVRALEAQTFRAFELIVIDNSGQGLVRREISLPGWARVIESQQNFGFGGGVNRAYRASDAPYLATLNDDAAPEPGWLGALVHAMERRPDAGMCASQVRLPGGRLDSAGMLVSGDGSSKQRGHGRSPGDFPIAEEVLLPSGSAALYRRAMLEDVGLFDEDFFLYCEDTDLGLRARWRGWTCLYAPDAVVEHAYSHSAGNASPLKAYYVERNRLFVLVKNYPGRMLWTAPFISATRYFWHVFYMWRGRGAAARFREEGHQSFRMPHYVLKAHLALIGRLGRLRRARNEIRAAARLSPAVYRRLLGGHLMTARRVAEL